MEEDSARAAKRKRHDGEDQSASQEAANGPSTHLSASIDGGRSSQLIDVLPYVDPYSEEDKQAALRMIREEMASMEFDEAAYLERALPPPPIPHFLGGSADLLEAEMARVGAGKPPTGGFDASRYALRHPQGPNEKDPKAWEEAIEQARLVLQHQHVRLTNLRLLEQFGPNAWLANNQGLQAMHQKLEEELRAVRSSIEELNRKRLEDQQAAGTKLHRAQTEWMELVQKNVQLEMACQELQRGLPS